MRLSLALVPLALIGSADRAEEFTCAEATGEIHHVSAMAAEGRIAIEDALIDYREANDVLELTVRDRRSGAITILELPLGPSQTGSAD
jgi:hypothetical protein